MGVRQWTERTLASYGYRPSDIAKIILLQSVVTTFISLTLWVYCVKRAPLRSWFDTSTTNAKLQTIKSWLSARSHKIEKGLESRWMPRVERWTSPTSFIGKVARRFPQWVAGGAESLILYYASAPFWFPLLILGLLRYYKSPHPIELHPDGCEITPDAILVRHAIHYEPGTLASSSYVPSYSYKPSHAVASRLPSVVSETEHARPSGRAVTWREPSPHTPYVRSSRQNADYPEDDDENDERYGRSQAPQPYEPGRNPYRFERAGRQDVHFDDDDKVRSFERARMRDPEDDPSRGLYPLEPVRDDGSRYRSYVRDYRDEAQPHHSDAHSSSERSWYGRNEDPSNRGVHYHYEWPRRDRDDASLDSNRRWRQESSSEDAR